MSVIRSGLESVSVDELKAHPRNPRRGDLPTIKQSLTTNGQYRPIVVNRRTGEVLAGNHVLRAARELGWATVEVVFVDASDDRALAILLADNRTSDLATYDNQELADLLAGLEDLSGTGYDEQALDDLLEGLAAGVPLEEDEVPPLPAEPKTRPGELVDLGRHRLACGDARDPAVYERLLDGDKAALLATDPPYGVDYEGKTRARLRLANDCRSGLSELLSESFKRIDEMLVAGAAAYVFSPAGPQLPVFVAAFSEAGWSLRQTLAWVKDALVLGHLDYHYRHEAILFGYKPGEGRLGRGGRGWYGDNRQTSVLEVPRPRASREHPTAKPPELVAMLLRNSSRRGDLVLDPFAGSGSTLVACEQLGRGARLIELDPRYCDVTVERFERLTGKQATRIRA